MTIDEIRIAVLDTIDAASWATLGNPVKPPIHRPNHPFKAPANTLWIRPTVLMADTEEGEIGDVGVSEQVGALIVQTFAPLETGSQKSNQMAVFLGNLFRRKDISGARFGEPTIREIGSDGGFYQVNVSIPLRAWIGE
jgi:hypothetical protein